MNNMTQLVQTSQLLSFKYGGNIDVDPTLHSVTWTLPWIDVPHLTLQEIKDTIDSVFKNEYKITWHEWHTPHPITNKHISIHTVIISMTIQTSSFYRLKKHSAKIIKFKKDS